MKKLKLLYILLIFTFIPQKHQAQVWESAWGLGFGGVYPRFMGVTTPMIAEDENFGAYVSLSRFFTEHISARFISTILHMEASYYTDNSKNIMRANMLTGSLDFVYRILPCEFISPYIVAGYGFHMFKANNAITPENDQILLRYQFDLGAGMEWDVSDDWNLRTEVGYITASHNRLDGNSSRNELKGLFRTNGDSYMTFNVGAIWYFSTGKKSSLCDDDAIVGMGIREVPVEVIKIDTVIKIEKEPVEVIKEIEKIDLFGVNFEFDKAVFLPESYPLLTHALDILKTHPEIKVEIHGHTDSRGSDEYNQKLSERRANAVKDYLVKNGIEGNRLKAIGFGEKFPIKDNGTDEGRAFNRRIEMKIVE